MNGYKKEYLFNKQEYLKLFDSVMQEEQEQNVEFLEKSITKVTGRKYAVAVGNGTDALHFSLISLGIKPGDEVLTTNFSWISTASCISMTGATPVFCDVDPESWNMTLEDIKKVTTKKTKAVLMVHTYGLPSPASKIEEYCKENDIILIVF